MFGSDADEAELFGGFDAGPPAAPAHAAPAAAPPAEGPQGLALPPQFAHLGTECLLSVAYRRLAPEDRARLESLLRQMAVPPESEQQPGDDTPVHFFQSYVVDYAGEVDGAAAAALRKPVFEPLLSEPLPGRAAPAPSRGPNRQRSRPGFQGRYFDAEPNGGTPGVLSAELRALLGIGEHDPPQYLARMRNLGYPPGYLGRPGQPAAEPADPQLEFFEQPAPPQRAASSAPPPEASTAPLVPTVDFPGLNVPPPADCDPARWGWRGPVAAPLRR
jgi:hypothetical protein